MFVAGQFVRALAHLLDYALEGYKWVVIIRALLSWVNPDPYNPIVRALAALTDPVFSFLRRRFPLMAGTIDLSPLVIIFVIYFLQLFLVPVLLKLSFQIG